MMSKPLRKTMPETAAWIDTLRDAFGAESIEDAIRRGMAGEPTFYAIEQGREIGTRSSDNANTWRLEGFDDRHLTVPKAKQERI